MSYKTYTTEAIVCGSSAHNTSDKQYLLFARESGMLFAHARSVREERSKQRYALQDFSRVRVSLVKGKSGWRIGSVEPLGNAFLGARSRASRALVAFVVRQLRRYVHGEVPLPQAFSDANELLSLSEGDEREPLEELFLVRLLAELGYVADHSGTLDPVLFAPDLKSAAEGIRPEMRVLIKRAINDGAQASHL